MASQEERMLILKMIDEGKISADEGARLLAAIQAPEDESSSGGSEEAEAPSTRNNFASNLSKARSVTNHAASARNIRLRVSDSQTDQERIDVNVPLKIVEFGLRFVPETIDERIENIRTAVYAGKAGPVLDIKDSGGDNRVEISLE